MPDKPTYRNFLPPEVSSDMHQIIAKAIYQRFAHPTGDGGAIRINRQALLEAAEAEFEYAILDDGSLLFRPVLDSGAESGH